jgi:predicted acyltransferase (DUF342 family)
MWENANLTVAPNMAINSNFYVAQNSATLDIGYRDGNSTQLIKSWYWNADGTLTLPTAGRINFDYLSISSDANVSAFYAPAGNVQLAAGIGDAQIVASSLSDSKTWTFGNTGNLTAPGNISAVGNVTAQNFIGNISITGNVTGTSSNVTLVAGSYSTVFDNTGTATFPGAMQLAVYANTTVRDSSITSPQPGMMIYVTGTGMQVRGETSWNTITGSGT